MLEKLLDAGGDPSAALSNGNRPAHLAVRLGNPKFVEMLMEARVDPNARGEANQPAVYMALPGKNVKVLEVLAAGGADLNIVWSGASPLYAAISTLNWTMATATARLGAENKFKDAQDRSSVDLVCVMMTRAQPDKENKPGVSALLASLDKRGIAIPCAPSVVAWR